MSKVLEKYLLKTYLHPDLNKVTVLRVMPKSRTQLEVQVVDKGVGYSKEEKKYTGVKKPAGWMRGQNYDQGHVDVVHFKDLKEIEEED